MALKLTVHFNCSTKVAYVKDDSTYSSPSSVRKYVVGQLNDPSGNAIFIKNTTNDPLISFDAQPRVSNNYTLGGTIQAGNYTFSGSVVYEYSNQDASPLNQFALFTAANQFSILNANLTEALLPGGVIMIDQAANPANNGTYNVTAVEYDSANSTKITVSQSTFVPSINTPDEDAQVGFDTTIVVANNVVYNYSTCASTLCPEISFTYDAFSTQYGNATLLDTTNYYGWSNITKTLSLYYPAGLSPAPVDNPVETNTSNIAIDELATGIYTCKLVTTGSYVQNDGLVIDVTATKIKQATVIAYTEMCGIQGCITKMLDRHVSYLKSAKISPLQQYVDQVYGLYINAKEALACGDKSTYSNYVSQIYTILGTNEDSCGTCSCGGTCDSCSDSCGCGQPDEPVWIDNLGINIDSLLTQFEDFIDNTWPSYQIIIDSLNDQVNNDIIPQLTALETTVSSLGTQTTTNTGDISGLQTQVDTLDSEVATLQEQIAEFSPANSEVALNELFTNDGSAPLNYTAISGTPIAGSLQTKYGLFFTGDVVAEFQDNQVLVFYSPADKAWFEGVITDREFKPAPNNTQITITSGINVNWTTNNTNFYVFKAKPDDSDYWFKRNITISNDSFWKFGDLTHKYWTKIKSSFLYNGSVGSNFEILNNTTGQVLTLKDINPGSIVDFELTMEKQYKGVVDYDCVFLLDVKVNSSRNSVNVSNVMVHDGCTGYVPYGYVDLYQNLSIPDNYSFSNLSVTNRSGLLAPTQDVLSTGGNNAQNINRLMTRFASGPSYQVGTSGQQFFTGNVTNDIVFNATNNNIVLLNFEVSYGKMPA